MIRGVTEGFKFKMKLAYAHFPIQDFVAKDGKSVEIKHFLGERRVRRIDALEGVSISKKEEEKSKNFYIFFSLKFIYLKKKKRYFDINRY